MSLIQPLIRTLKTECFKMPHLQMPYLQMAFFQIRVTELPLGSIYIDHYVKIMNSMTIPDIKMSFLPMLEILRVIFFPSTLCFAL